MRNPCYLNSFLPIGKVSDLTFWFQDFLFVFSFQNFYWDLSWPEFPWIYFVSGASWSCRLVSFARFWEFHLFLKNTFSAPPFLLCWEPIDMNVKSFVMVPHVSVVQVFIKGNFYCSIFNFNGSFLCPNHSVGRPSTEFLFCFCIFQF